MSATLAPLVVATSTSRSRADSGLCPMRIAAAARAGSMIRSPLVPFALTFAAVGAVAAARCPRAAVRALGVLAFYSFAAADLQPLMNWPAWVADLSVFQLYGTPLLAGVFWNGLWAMLAIALLGYGLATVPLQRREVGP